jgi:hypothetical protein
MLLLFVAAVAAGGCIFAPTVEIQRELTAKPPAFCTKHLLEAQPRFILRDLCASLRYAGWCLYPAAMFHPHPAVQKTLREAAAVFSRQHPGKPEGQIVQAFVEANSRGMRWLIQQLEGVIPKVADPVLHGMLLLARCQMQPLPDQPELPHDLKSNSVLRLATATVEISSEYC